MQLASWQATYVMGHVSKGHGGHCYAWLDCAMCPTQLLLGRCSYIHEYPTSWTHNQRIQHMFMLEQRQDLLQCDNDSDTDDSDIFDEDFENESYEDNRGSSRMGKRKSFDEGDMSLIDEDKLARKRVKIDSNSNCTDDAYSE